MFVLLLLNVRAVNSYGHDGAVAFDFVGLLPDSETSSQKGNVRSPESQQVQSS